MNSNGFFIRFFFSSLILVFVVITSFSCPFSGVTILICCYSVFYYSNIFFFSFQMSKNENQTKFFMILAQAVFGLHVDLSVNGIGSMD